jgi:hypothetical protein
MSNFCVKIFGVNFFKVPNEYPNPATVVTEALIYTWSQVLYTGNIFHANSANNQAST